MCGIVGVIGRADAAPLLLEGLRRLEYRGYDSGRHRHAGSRTTRSVRRRAPGKLVTCWRRCCTMRRCTATTGIGHTRWATHGAPDGSQCPSRMPARTVAIVHNGIIENFTPS